MIYMVNAFQKKPNQEYNTWRYHVAGDVIQGWFHHPWVDALDDSVESRFARAALLNNPVPYSKNPLYSFAEIKAAKGEAPAELRALDPKNGVVDLVCVIDTDDDNCLRYTIIVRRK